jgi:hypothetical protein
MAIKFLQNIDLGQNQLLNARIHVAGSEPSGKGEGSVWLDSGNNTLKFYVADTGGGSAGWLSVLDDTNDNSTTFTLTADSGTNQTIAHGNTLDIAGGASITTSVGNTDTVTIDVTDNTIGAAELNVSGNGGATQFLRSDGDGSFSWAVPTDTNTDTNTQNVFASSFVDSSSDCILRLTKSGASSGTQDIKFVAGSNVTLTPSGTNLTIASANTNTQLSTEAVQDIVGAMFTGNTETRIAATYQDGDGTIDLVVNDMTSNTNTQNVFTSSFVDSEANGILRLTKSGAASGTQDITFAAGSNITITPNSSTQMTIAATNTNTQLSNAQVRAAVAAATDSQVFTDADHTKLNGIDTSADVTTAATVKAALGNAMSSNTLTIGDGSTTTTIPGDLTVTGTTTTNNVQTVSTSNGVIFEGNAADANEGTLLAGTLSADRTYTLPNKSGTVAMTSDLIANTNTQNAYAVSAADGSNTSREKIVLTGSGAAGSTTDFVEIGAGTGLSIARSGEVITLTNTVSNTNTQLSTEAVQDIVGAMFSGNTETRIAATYQDGDGTIDLVVNDMTANSNTQNVFTSSFVDSSADALLRLTKSGAASGTQDIKFVAGDNVTLTPSGTNLTITATDTTIAARTAGAGLTLTSNSLSTTQFTGALAAATSGISKSSNTYTVTHGLGNVRVNVIITTVASPFEQVFPEINYANATGNGTVKVIFGQGVSDSDYNVTVTR